MSVFHARRGQVAYGYAIGVLCAEWHIPFIPGDLNNANTFDFPVRYLSVPGASGSGVLNGSDPKFERLFVEAAQQLESEGVRAITSPLFTKRRILSPMCLPISPLGPKSLLLNPLLSPTTATTSSRPVCSIWLGVLIFVV